MKLGGKGGQEEGVKLEGGKWTDEEPRWRDGDAGMKDCLD